MKSGGNIKEVETSYRARWGLPALRFRHIKPADYTRCQATVKNVNVR